MRITGWVWIERRRSDCYTCRDTVRKLTSTPNVALGMRNRRFRAAILGKRPKHCEKNLWNLCRFRKRLHKKR